MTALNLAFFVNAAILIVSAAAFNSRGIVVTQIQQAQRLLEPVLGSRIAPVAFAVALLAAGQSSTLTGTISGQVVMEGFLNIRMQPWLRRLLTRGLALIPAVIVIALAGNEGTYRLLIFSQVVLSLQLPFAVIPLIHFTSDKNKMGAFANNFLVKLAAWCVAAIIVALNLKLVWDQLFLWTFSRPSLWLILAPVVLLFITALAFVASLPLFRKAESWPSEGVKVADKIAHDIEPMTLKHIGVALEHSSGDAKIISAALMLAKSHKAGLTLVHVVDTPGVTVFGDESQSLHGSGDQAYLERLADEIEERGFFVDTDLRFGHPIDQLVRSVKTNGFDLLVLGSHGHRLFGDLVFGQTVDSVRHAIDIPVFVVRTPAQEPPQQIP
jgi:manganese transport protein